MPAEVFRPQSVGRALRTAFMLGVFIVIAIIAAVGAAHQFSALVGDNTKDELSRYLDDNAHSNAHPDGGGFSVDFPVPPERQPEQVTTGGGSIAALRDHALVDDEVTFDAVWFQLPGNPPANTKAFLAAFVALQIHQLGGTKIGSSADTKAGTGLGRDTAFVVVDHSGAKRYFDERIILQGKRMWFLRIGSRIRRDAAFQKFTGSFKITGT